MRFYLYGTIEEERPDLAKQLVKYNISSASNIIRSCQNVGKHAGILNGEKLAWEYAMY